MTMLIENPKNKGKAQALQVVQCHNLCPADTTGEILCPTGVPRTILSGGWRPLACVDTATGKRMALHRYSGSHSHWQHRRDAAVRRLR